MTFREFLKSKIFLRQLLLALAASVVVLWVSLKLLDTYTLHGRSITVPDLEGFHEADVKPLLSRMNLRYVINDSIFDDSREKGTIAAQTPAPGTEVKRNRTIYLTMVAFLPEMIPMPDLNDLSLRQAVTVLETYGLHVGQLETRPDIAVNAVLQQKYNHGIIEPGTLVEKGTAIDLVIGAGLGQSQVQVPNVVGLDRREAINRLHSASLNVGNEIFVDTDESGSELRVYRQSPDPITRTHFLQAGSTVDIYYRSAEDFDFDAYLEELLTVPIPMLYGKTPNEVLETLEALGLELGEEVFEDNVSREKARVYMQMPEYDEEGRIQSGKAVDVWYRSVDAFDLDS
jgi:eukaryotic-like serine/threonine-protein kinase